MAEAYIDVGEARLWTMRTGSGPPVLLCSGGPGCCDYMEPVAGMIDDVATVYRWEQRGCGRSEAGGPYDLATCLRDMEALRESFGLKRWIVGGHSWGANLALAYAAAYPHRMVGLVFLSGTGLDLRWKPTYRAAKAERTEALPEMAYPPNMVVNRSGNRSYEQYLARPDLRERVRAVTCPALFVHGSHDLRPAWAPQEIAELLPNAAFHLIDGAEHVLWLNHAQRLRDILQNFTVNLRAI